MVLFRECVTRFPKVATLETHWNQVEQDFPIRITRSWFNRIQSPQDPLGKQVFPQPSELLHRQQQSSTSLIDPVGEQGKQLHPFVVQKHADRVLLLLSRHCHLHCRYCFRRTLPNTEEPSDIELSEAIELIVGLNVQEVILTGGDPLFATDKRLQWVLDALSSIPTIRIHSRAPITFPQRVTENLCDMLSKFSNVWLIVHCNHTAELSVDVLTGLRMFQQVGVPILNQTVLLKGVNDDAQTLVQLFQRLVELRVYPYYLHHTDRVAGAEDFFVTLQEGWGVYQQVARKVSGVALPTYIIDLPNGTGKIPVERVLSNPQDYEGLL